MLTRTGIPTLLIFASLPLVGFAYAADPNETPSDVDPRPLKSVIKLSERKADTVRPGASSAVADQSDKPKAAGKQTAESKAAPGWLGRVVFVKENARAMIKDRQIAVKDVPFPARVQRVNGNWLWVERAWVQTGDTLTADDAQTYYDEIIAKEPTVSAYVHRGAVYAAKGDLDKAIADFDEAINQDPQNAVAHAERGIAYAEKGHLNKAISGFTEALKIDPKNIEANNNLAWLRATNSNEHVRDGAEAVKLANVAYEVTNHKEWGACDTLAAAYAEQKNFAEALTMQQRAVELAVLPDDKKIAQSHLELYKAKKPVRDVKK